MLLVCAERPQCCYRSYGDFSLKHCVQLYYKILSKHFGQDCSVATWQSLYFYNWLYLIDKDLDKFMKCLGWKLLKSEQLAQAKNVFHLNIKEHRQLDGIFIGFYTKVLLKKMFAECDISLNDRDS